VLAITRFSTDEEAVAIANRTRYGLEPHTNAFDGQRLRFAAGRRQARTNGAIPRILERKGRSMAYLTARAHDGDRLIATGQIVKAIVPADPTPRPDIA
jgi:hypothetical protein